MEPQGNCSGCRKHRFTELLNYFLHSVAQKTPEERIDHPLLLQFSTLVRLLHVCECKLIFPNSITPWVPYITITFFFPHKMWPNISFLNISYSLRIHTVPSSIPRGSVYVRSFSSLSRDFFIFPFPVFYNIWWSRYSKPLNFI